jgi:hypothetical protein
MDLTAFKVCAGPLCRGALRPIDIFTGFKTCSNCLERSRTWKHLNPEKLKSYDTWANPDKRFRQNMVRLGMLEAAKMKKEDFTGLLKVGQGWSNYYVNGKRSWKFVTAITDDGLKYIEAKWS